jgi:hypothetical protein
MEDGRYEYTPKRGGAFVVTAEALVKRLVALTPPVRTTKPKRPRLDWATLHRRTFGTDVLRCPPVPTFFRCVAGVNRNLGASRPCRVRVASATRRAAAPGQGSAERLAVARWSGAVPALEDFLHPELMRPSPPTSRPRAVSWS